MNTYGSIESLASYYEDTIILSKYTATYLPQVVKPHGI